MDLDNTLWGGEIGDLGEDGLILGKRDGEGYLILSYIKQLADMGVLAVCSKNNEI